MTARATIVVTPPPSASQVAAVEDGLIARGAITVERVDEPRAVRWVVELSTDEIARAVTEVLEAHGVEAAVEVQPAAASPARWPWRRRVAPETVGPLTLVEAASVDVPVAGRVLRIEPGMALGTASNPATVMCLEWLVERARRGPPPRTMLDVGTGTGILALAACALGVPRVVAVDVDPEARAMARENAALNGLTLEVPDVGVGALTERFELVVCNIITEIMAPLAPVLVARCAPAGELVLGGATEDEVEELTAAFEPYGWALRAQRARQGVTVVTLGAVVGLGG